MCVTASENNAENPSDSADTAISGAARPVEWREKCTANSELARANSNKKTH